MSNEARYGKVFKEVYSENRGKGGLVAGPVFVDSIFSGLPAMPELGKEVYGEHYLVTIGGCAITAIGLARLGISTEIAAAIGGDLFGTFLEERLVKEGVSCRGVVKIASEHTNATTAMVYARRSGLCQLQRRGAARKRID